MVKPKPIPTGTLCIVTDPQTYDGFWGLECTVVGHGLWHQHGHTCIFDHQVEIPHVPESFWLTHPRASHDSLFIAPWSSITPIDPKLPGFVDEEGRELVKVLETGGEIWKEPLTDKATSRLNYLGKGRIIADLTVIKA